MNALVALLLVASVGAQEEEPPYHVRLSIQLKKGITKDVVLQVRPEWAPRGAKRFGELVDAGFYAGARFFRVVPGFVAQFGLAGKPALNDDWGPIEDDPVVESNAKYTVSFATSGPNSRTTQLFVNLVDNKQLDGMQFSPFAKVVDGFEAVDAIYSGYGEKPDQTTIRAEGNTYLKKQFPKLTYVVAAKRVDTSPADEP